MAKFSAKVKIQTGAQVRADINTRRYERGLRRAFGRMSDEVKQAVNQTRIDVQNHARSLAPVDTGRLRSSITSRAEVSGRSVGYVVGTNVNYAAAVEYGTAPHVILPKNKKALYWPGAAHPVAKVNHPGTAPQPFMRPAIEMSRVFFEANLSKIRGG